MGLQHPQTIRYIGCAEEPGKVWVHLGTEGLKLLDPRHDVVHHCDGFSWGSLAEGSAQLALAILLDVLQRQTAVDAEPLALQLHQDYKLDCITRCPAQGDLEISEGEVIEWLRHRGVRLQKSRDLVGASAQVGPVGRLGEVGATVELLPKDS